MPTIRISSGRARRVAGLVAVLVAMASFTSTGFAASPQDARGVVGVVTRDGKPVGNADVYVAAWPTQWELEALPAGGEVVMAKLKPVRTDRRGRFKVDVSGLDPRYVTEKGVANLQLTAVAGGDIVNWGFPLTVDPAARTKAERRSAEMAGLAADGAAPVGRVPEVMDLRLEVGDEPGVGLPGNEQKTWAPDENGNPVALTSDGLVPVDDMPATDATEGGISAMGVVSGSRCPAATGYVTKTGNWKYGVYEAFANVWAGSRSPVTLHQAYRSSHTLGMAFKNTSGKWSQSGTYSYEQEFSGSGDKAGLIDRKVYNQVNYAEFRCGQLYSNALLGYAWLPQSIYAIASKANYISPHPRWSACSAYSNGDKMIKSAGTNITYGGGVGFGPITLSAQAGWSADTSLTWNFTGNSWLCGNTSSGWVSSPQAESHNR